MRDRARPRLQATDHLHRPPEDDIPANTGFCHNAYPFPNDALDPYEPGSYPRVQPFDPPGPNGQETP